MRRLIFMLLALMAASSLTASADNLSDIRDNGSWYQFYNEKGRRFNTMAKSSVGDILGWSATFFVSQKGSWIYLYDSNGKRMKTLAASSVGEVISVAGNTFTSRKGSWIYTYDRDGKRINTRAAR